MATRAERKALVFLTAVLIVGSSLRIVNAFSHDHSPPAGARDALARQLAAVDSARLGPKAARGRSPRPSGSGVRQRRSAGTIPRPPVSRGRAPASDSACYFLRGERCEPAPTERAPAGPASAASTLIDVDRAPASEIERLPRIGPVLAQRIVADRDAHGQFGSLQGLTRVRGVGPAMAQALHDRVTFSGTARPSTALGPTAATAPRVSRKPARRGPGT